MRHLRPLIIAIALVTGGRAGAQAPIPIRKVGPILATSTENVGEAVSVRGTSDGHVLVGSRDRQRVYAFDSTLTHFTLAVDSGTGVGMAGARATRVIPYLGDSTIVPDAAAGALHVFDPSGKQVRSIAPPKVSDLVYLTPGGYGRPSVDAKGRLFYRPNITPKFGDASQAEGAKLVYMPMSVDSQPVVRGDFDTRRVDTVAWIKTPTQGRIATEIKQNLAGGPPSTTFHMLANPFVTQDEWALLSDGTIAIVRVHDYHVDWVDPDGSRRSSPKMPFDWRRYTDAEHRQIADSLKRQFDESSRAAGAQDSRRPRMELNIVPDSEFPEYWPPVEPGSVQADLDAHLWILPTTSTNAGNGFTYDVVDRTGTVIERVQLPKDRVLVGFGPHNVIYMARTEGKATYLERAVFSVSPR